VVVRRQPSCARGTRIPRPTVPWVAEELPMSETCDGSTRYQSYAPNNRGHEAMPALSSTLIQDTDPTTSTDF